MSAWFDIVFLQFHSYLLLLHLNNQVFFSLLVSLIIVMPFENEIDRDYSFQWCVSHSVASTRKTEGGKNGGKIEINEKKVRELNLFSFSHRATVSLLNCFERERFSCTWQVQNGTEGAKNWEKGRFYVDSNKKRRIFFIFLSSETEYFNYSPIFEREHGLKANSLVIGI